METEEQINAGSNRAKRIGNALVKDINERLFSAVAEGLVPGYNVVAVVDDIRQGSLWYHLSLHAEIIIGASSASIHQACTGCARISPNRGPIFFIEAPPPISHIDVGCRCRR